ncbi:40S ribosomal protein S7 [Coprinopsis marcescibilis]|uniref:40S ribosomal protein S7 n=1 Tax=Coprinopsis marcescibilis TaxID=230819 RepID=A0A5C3L917_COPMA|nr:40S ribosomal protein S7 [Coprinopsis marcescibilis]
MSGPQSYGPKELSREELDVKIAELQGLPLFMQSLPEEESENPMIAALQSLAHEGTPDEIATNFKEQGNNYFKGKRYREALGFYTQGVDAKPTDQHLMNVLLCNRAACNLELKNYGSVLRDCSTALKSDPTLAKAYYRSGQALLTLDRVDEALDCCDRSLKLDADNQSMQALREKVVSRKEVKDKAQRVKEERLKRERAAKAKLTAAFRERNLVEIQKPDGSENPYQPHWDAEDPNDSTLIFPVFFLYPQYATSDIIPEFVEDTTYAAHLEQMFPPVGSAPEWDVKKEYTAKNLNVYAITQQKRLLKVGRKMSMRDVFKNAKPKPGEPSDGLEIKDGCLTFVVVPKGDAEQDWIRKFKASRGGYAISTANRIGIQELQISQLQALKRLSGDNDMHRLWPFSSNMSVAAKIQRTANAPNTPPDEIETQVAQSLLDLENNVPELKSELRVLQISAAREVDVRGGKKAIVIFVPVPQLKAFHKIQQRLTRELEKKFSDRHVVFVAQRRMLRKPTRTSRVLQKRPRSRTLTSVHEKILEDLVFPTEIVGKRTRVAVDGSKLLKVFLDSKDATSLEYKLDSFSSVYRRLTGKDVVFEFPVVSHGEKA